MIRLHRLNDQEVTVNADLIETVESHGVETVLALTTGNKIIVKEPVSEVIQRAIEYKKAVYAAAQERSITCHSHS